MNLHSLQDIVRFGAIVLIALVGLVLLAEGAKSTRGYTLVTKLRTKPREIRGLRPQSLSTAIGFGKRESSLRSSDLDKHKLMMFLPQTDVSQRFPILWFLQYLKSNPDLATKVQRQLLSNNNDEDEDEHKVKTLATYRYKKHSDSDDYYYLNK